MSLFSPAAAPNPASAAKAEAPPPTLAPQGSKPKQKSQASTFLGSDALPASGVNSSNKTLLGQ